MTSLWVFILLFLQLFCMFKIFCNKNLEEIFGEKIKPATLVNIFSLNLARTEHSKLLAYVRKMWPQSTQVIRHLSGWERGRRASQLQHLDGRQKSKTKTFFLGSCKEYLRLCQSTEKTRLTESATKNFWFSLFPVAEFCIVTLNTELVSTEPLLLGEIQG